MVDEMSLIMYGMTKIGPFSFTPKGVSVIETGESGPTQLESRLELINYALFFVLYTILHFPQIFHYAPFFNIMLTIAFIMPTVLYAE